jgi:PhnB protein
MQFYETALGGKIEVMLSGGESPIAAHIPVETAHRILHARLVLSDGGMLFAGDCPQGMAYEGIKGMSLTLNYDTILEAERAFNALAEGGKITMPMQSSFWAKTWGMLVDRFGTSWNINGEPLPI